MAARILLALLAATLLVGCKRTPTGPNTSPLFLPALAVGEVHLPGRPAREIVVEGGAQGGEYVLVALNTSTASGRLALEITGSGLGALGSAQAPGALSLLAAQAATPELLRERGRARLEGELRRRQVEQLEPLVEVAREEVLRRRAPGSGALLRRPLALGDTIALNSSATCPAADAQMRSAHIAAVSTHAVVAVDTETPPLGFTTLDYQRFADQYDEIVHPLIGENFGPLADPFGTDGGRMVLFFTPVVNRMGSAEGYVAGFVWPGDLFPRAGLAGRFTACPGSNEREMVYLLVPDPTGSLGGQKHEIVDVERVTLSTIAHEAQHVVNAGRRMYVEPYGGFEDVWLNESLSHLAEELLMYRTSALAPRSRITPDDVLASAENRDAFIRHQRPNLLRYRWHLVHADSVLFDPRAMLKARGAGWSFLRFAADQRGGNEATLWRALIDTHRTGLDNLQHALAADAIPRLLDWSVSVYADGAVPGLGERWRQPSWDIRPVTAMSEVHPQGGYPLAVRPLSAEPVDLSLGAGGNAYLRFRVEAGSSGTVRISSGGRPPPGTLAYALVRIE